MKFITISDVHIKEEGDFSEKLFLSFLDQAKFLAVDKVYLLGDIFDLLVGGHLYYETIYPQVFLKLNLLLKSGIKIIQLEGNHDFHFKALIDKLLKKWQMSPEMWKYESSPVVEIVDGKRILFAHGDEIEIGNESYKKYRRFIRSGAINFLANKVVSPRITRKIGQRASHKSRKRNNIRYDEKYEEEKVRPLFRASAVQASSQYNASIVICGHSHCFDMHEEDSVYYLNNGYVPRTQKFFYFDGEKFESIKLDTSK